MVADYPAAVVGLEQSLTLSIVLSIQHIHIIIIHEVEVQSRGRFLRGCSSTHHFCNCNCNP